MDPTPDRLPPGAIGAATATGVVIITAIGAWLYRTLPPTRRKPLAVTMMVMGGLLLASVLVRTYELIEPSDAIDAIVIGLMIGGFLTFIVGFALFRKITLMKGEEIEAKVVQQAPTPVSVARPPEMKIPPRPRRS
jgi:hypothetical protein